MTSTWYFIPIRESKGTALSLKIWFQDKGAMRPVDFQTSRARISRGSQKEKLPSWSLRKTVARVNFLLVLLVSSSFLRIQERKRWCTLQFYGRCHAFFLPEMTTTVTLRDKGDRYEPSEVFWSPYKQRIFLSGLWSRAKKKWNSERY